MILLMSLHVLRNVREIGGFKHQLMMSPVRGTVDFSFEAEDSIEEMRQLILKEVSTFRASVRKTTPRQNSGPKRQET